MYRGHGENYATNKVSPPALSLIVTDTILFKARALVDARSVSRGLNDLADVLVGADDQLRDVVTARGGAFEAAAHECDILTVGVGLRREGEIVRRCRSPNDQIAE